MLIELLSSCQNPANDTKLSGRGLVIIIDLIISQYLFQSIIAGGGFWGEFLLVETQFSEGKHKN